MQTITLVSGNKDKIAEWQNQLPDTIQLLSRDIGLAEIQSIDPVEIITDKVKRAYEQLGSPVVVEDVSFSLPRLGGLPGPFIKFWLKPNGDGVAPLHQIIRDGEAATVTCTIGFYDGTALLIASGTVNGSITTPRGSHGFGFDSFFLPNDLTTTYAEMDVVEKNKMSHRSLAIADFVQKLHI